MGLGYVRLLFLHMLCIMAHSIAVIIFGNKIQPQL